MATTIREIKVRLGITGAELVSRQLSNIQGSADGVSRSFSVMGRTLIGAAGNVGTFAAAITGLGVALAAVTATRAFDAFTEFDSAIRGLATNSRSIGDLTAQLARLQRIAQGPGLGFIEAIQGSTRLQAAGLSASLAERSLRAFGNAIASIGGGKEQLDGVILALSQIQSKGVVSAEEINQIAERVPQIRRLLAQAFGTADTEAIQKLGLSATQAIERIVGAAEKLPRASGGIRNLLDNLSDLRDAALRSLGQGIADLLQSAAPAMERVIGTARRFFASIGEVLSAAGRVGAVADALNRALSAAGAGGDLRRVVAELVAGLLAAVAVAPTAFRQIVQFIVQSFDFLEKRFTAAVLRASAIVQETIVAPLAASALNRDGVREALAAADAARVVANAVDGLTRNPAAPLQQTFGQFRQLQQQYASGILGAIRPLPQIPGDVQATGGAAQSVASRQTTLLERIERHTGQTADALSLRRQAIGGGELGQLGVTAAELSAGQAFVTAVRGQNRRATTRQLARELVSGFVPRQSGI